MTDDLSTITTDDLFASLAAAMADGRFGEALKLANEICRVERTAASIDFMAPARSWPSMAKFGRETLQGLEDRIEQYNSNVRHHGYAVEMQAEVEATLGVWESPSGGRLVASYLEPEHVRLGDGEVVTNGEWLRRLDGLKDGGWIKAA